MNLNEIDEIDDKILKDIRLKYWNLRHEAAIDERNISDLDIQKVWDDLVEKENKEVEKYLQNNL